MTCIHHDTIIQDSFPALKILSSACSLLSLPSLPWQSLIFLVSTVLSSPECHSWKHTACSFFQIGIFHLPMSRVSSHIPLSKFPPISTRKPYLLLSPNLNTVLCQMNNPLNNSFNEETITHSPLQISSTNTFLINFTI